MSSQELPQKLLASSTKTMNYDRYKLRALILIYSPVYVPHVSPHWFAMPFAHSFGMTTLWENF